MKRINPSSSGAQSIIVDLLWPLDSERRGEIIIDRYYPLVLVGMKKCIHSLSLLCSLIYLNYNSKFSLVILHRDRDRDRDREGFFSSLHQEKYCFALV